MSNSNNRAFDESPLVYPLEAVRLGGEPGWKLDRQFLRAHWLLVATDGQGVLEADGKNRRLAEGSCCMLPPGTLASIASDGDEPLRIYRIALELLAPAREPAIETLSTPSGEQPVWNGAPEQDDGVLFKRDKMSASYFGELPPRPFHKVARLAGQLCEPNERSGARLPFRRQLLALELLEVLWSNQAAEELDSNRAIEHVLDYMRTHYAEELTRESLAAIAGMSEWHFAHTFKRRVGKSPMDCLNEIRMGKAKEKLLLSNARIRDIAQEVGFRDEFYFSRKFKKTIGLSPVHFQKRKLTKVASLSFPYAGHLLALGVIPYATFVDDRRDRHRQPFFSRIPYHLGRTKAMDSGLREHNLAKLLLAGPELILCDDDERHGGFERMNKIAPTVAIPWMRHDWRSHFRLIAALIGKEKEAWAWLRAYEQKAAHAAERLRQTIGNETVSIFHIMQGKLVVYGGRNGGAVLYGDLRLNPAFETSEISVFKEIGEEHMAGYAGDRLLLVVDADPLSRQLWGNLRQSAAWQSLKPVRRLQVHTVNETPLLDYSAFAHNQIIDMAVRLFCT